MPFRVLLCLILGLSNLLPMVTVIYYIDEYQKSPIKNRDPLLDFLNFDSPNTQRNSVYPSPRFKIA